jgi:peroxiredoxin Q/BCP
VEGCGYRDRQDEFDELGVMIVGVGFDTPADNQAWAEDEGFEFELWTDDDRTLALHYGATASASAAFPGRVTRVLDGNGDLVVEYLVSTIDAHPEQVLEDCRLLFGDGE